MKKCIWLLVMAVLIWVNYNNFFGWYYSDINEVAKRNHSYGKTLEVFWINKNPYVFYQTNTNVIRLLHLATKSKNNVLLYKSVYEENMGINNPFATLTFNSLDLKDKKTDNHTERILYGVLPKSDINRIKINGISPKLVQIDQGGHEYCLWYIIGGQELDEYANKRF